VNRATPPSVFELKGQCRPAVPIEFHFPGSSANFFRQRLRSARKLCGGRNSKYSCGERSTQSKMTRRGRRWDKCLAHERDAAGAQLRHLGIAAEVVLVFRIASARRGFIRRTIERHGGSQSWLGVKSGLDQP